MPRSPSPARSMSRSPSRSLSPEESDTIRIGKLTKNVSAIHIEEIFDVYGKIVDIDLPIIKRLGTHKGTAWVSFASPAAAAKAASYMDGGQIDGSSITVDLEPLSPRGGPPAGRGAGRGSVSPRRERAQPRGRSRSRSSSPVQRGRSVSRQRSASRSASPMPRSASPARARSPPRRSTGRQSLSPRRSPVYHRSTQDRSGSGGAKGRQGDGERDRRGRNLSRSPSPYDRARGSAKRK